VVTGQTCTVSGQCHTRPLLYRSFFYWVLISFFPHHPLPSLCFHPHWLGPSPTHPYSLAMSIPPSEFCFHCVDLQIIGILQRRKSEIYKKDESRRLGPFLPRFSPRPSIVTPSNKPGSLCRRAGLNFRRLGIPEGKRWFRSTTRNHSAPRDCDSFS